MLPVWAEDNTIGEDNFHITKYNSKVNFHIVNTMHFKFIRHSNSIKMF